MLKWEDILWDQEKIVVRSPKTEHHEDKGVRIIPFFPHIAECLTEAFEQAPEGAVYVVEKHAPLYLRGQKERVYISRQGNIGTMFRKIILRAGIVPWTKLIHNLRASFETDLLNGKYDTPTHRIGIHTIAEWLGHSVKVMLEHYGRIQESDFDCIAIARERVKQQKDQSVGKSSTLSPHFLRPNDGSIAENTDSNALQKVSQNPTQYTAVGGGIKGNGMESPVCANQHHALENKEHEGNEQQEEVSCVNCPKPRKRMERDSNPRYVSARRFSRPVP